VSDRKDQSGEQYGERTKKMSNPASGALGKVQTSGETSNPECGALSDPASGAAGDEKK
jgi:hypothetical protein